MKKSLVSIIVPCYNQAQYLDEALQSVLDQTYPNWECIIVNDGSQDKTEEIALKWCKKDSKFQYFCKKNQGVSSARNFGINLAKGRFIQFLDGDDLLGLNKINYQVQIMDINPNIDVVYGSSRYFFDGNISNVYPIHYLGIVPTIEMNMTDHNQKDVLLYHNICTICAGLYRKEIFEKIIFKNIVFEDWFFHIECVLNDLIFHYATDENICSFIRMTKQSQMKKHIIENQKSKKFNEELKKLLTLKKYSSRLIEERNLSWDIQEIRNRSFFKKIAINITPPIVIKTVNKIYNSISCKR